MTELTSQKEYRLGITAGIMIIIGVMFSGPLTFLAVSLIKPQPGWISSQVYVEHYHPIQSVTFYFGFLLIIGSVLMIGYIHSKQDDLMSLLALVFTSISCAIIGLNYSTEATIIPAMMRNYSPELDPIIQLFSVTNPSSIFWSIEMWGYGFLGLGTYFAKDFFSENGIELWARRLFILNGILSVIGAVYTGIHVEWVLSTAGLVSYALWNVLYFAIAILFTMVLIRRRKEA